MYKMSKKCLAYLCIGVMLLGMTACGKSGNEDSQNSQVDTQQNTQNTQETETETRIEIADANEILTEVWETYEEKFAIMGGHFDSAVMDKPAKYDLTKTSDLELMYCVPQTVIAQMDDAATMVHLMRASIFTAGAYHITDTANVKAAVDGIKQQILDNQWLDGFPDTYLIMVVDGQYVVAVIGDTQLVEHFESATIEIYGKQAAIWVKENIR